MGADRSGLIRLGVLTVNYEQLLEQAIAEVLHLDPAQISRSRSFFEQGIDSLAGLRICRRLADLSGIEIDVEWIFDHPSIEQLAAFLHERQEPAVAARQAS